MDGNDAGGVDLLFTPTSGATILDLNICVNVTHTWVGDLIITLEHDSTGTTVTLFDNVACTGTDLFVYFDDEAALSAQTSCGSGQPALEGVFRPLGSLSDFDLETFDGQWTLNVADLGVPDTGNALGARIDITTP